MKKLTAVTVISTLLMAMGCETAPTDQPADPAGNAAAPTNEDIEKARAIAAQTLPEDLSSLSSFANEPLSLPPAAPMSPVDKAGDLEAQLQAISWGCRLAFYPQPQWWQGVFGLQALKGLGVIKDRNTCKKVVGSAPSLTAFLTEKGQLKYLTVLLLIVWAGGSCACDYVF